MTIEHPGTRTINAGTSEPIAHFHSAIAQGHSWTQALLETISFWTALEENFQGRHFKYLLNGEALDWLLLAERLCLEAPSYLTEQEKETLLFAGRLPEPLTAQEFKAILGTTKYGACLNFWYGVIVEEALLEAVEEEFYKASRSRGRPDDQEGPHMAFALIYGAMEEDLLYRFRSEQGYPQVSNITLTEKREFTYWLFKFRIRNQEPARIASDTRKGLDHLYTNFGISSWEP